MAGLRLYYEDPYLRTFSARVTATATLNQRPAVTLDQSAFYPEGGGQPPDHGTLNNVRVCDVQMRNGDIWHVLELAPGVAGPEVGDEVAGRLDWARRFDHMQQHLGQHLITAALLTVAGAATIACSVDEETAAIDLDICSLSDDQMQAAEDLANQMIWEDRPVLARFISFAELADLLQRESAGITGSVRVVSIADFDHTPCGGTHPQRTGAVGMVKLLGWSRQKNGVRVEFVCGKRALAAYRSLNHTINRAAAVLGVGRNEVEPALTRLHAANETNRREATLLREQIVAGEAQELLDQAVPIGQARIVCKRLPNRDADQLRHLARSISRHPGTAALLGTVSDQRLRLVVACAADLRLQARDILSAALPLVQGRSNGSALLAHTSGTRLDALDAALDALLARVTESLLAVVQVNDG